MFYNKTTDSLLLIIKPVITELIVTLPLAIVEKISLGVDHPLLTIKRNSYERNILNTNEHYYTLHIPDNYPADKLLDVGIIIGRLQFNEEMLTKLNEVLSL